MGIPVRPRLFIASSREAYDSGYVRAIESHLKSNADIVAWTRAFPPGDHNMESIEKELDSCDFAVVILSPDDKVTSRGVTRECARDNVLLELGLFVGRIGRRRTFALCEAGQDARPSDYRGITCLEYSRPEKGDTEGAFALACDAIKAAIVQKGSIWLSKCGYKAGEPLRITVTGSQDDRFQDAVGTARALGRKLVDLNVEAISGIATGVDEAFCRGFADALSKRGQDPRDRLKCYYKKSEPHREGWPARQLRSKFEFRTEGTPELVSEANVVILLGGGTHIAYLGAMALREGRILLPVAAVGGSSIGLLEVVRANEDTRTKRLLSRTQLDALGDTEAKEEKLAHNIFGIVRSIIDRLPSTGSQPRT